MSEILLRKLGVKPDSQWAVLGAPDGFIESLKPLPEGCFFGRSIGHGTVGRIVFAVTAEELSERFAQALEGLPATGAIWIAWPKKTSGVATELAFSTVQGLGLSHGLVDNKICAIDDVWTALRFVVPLKARAEWGSLVGG